MAEASDSKGILFQNLEDAGCGNDLAEQVMAYLEAGRTKEGITLLTKYRRSLLDSCHAQQRKLDCLDYLIYQLKHERMA